MVTSLLGKELVAPQMSAPTLERNQTDLVAAKADFDNDPSLANTIWYGRRLAYMFQYAEAFEVFDEGIKRFPQSHELLRHRGHRYISTRQFERAIIESGTRLFKLWFDVSRKEQRRRIKSRKKDLLKQWKLSPMDFDSMARWDDYTKARDGMFLYTDTKHAPWTIVRSDDKRRARINAILAVLNRLNYPDQDKKVVVPADPLIIGNVPEMIPLEGRFMFAELES